MLASLCQPDKLESEGNWLNWGNTSISLTYKNALFSWLLIDERLEWTDT